MEIQANIKRAWQKTLPYREWIDALWKSPWTGAALLLVFGALAVFWLLKTPSPGKAVAALGVLAILMTFRGELRGLEKTFLTIVVFLFVFIESSAIDKDRAENKTQQREFFQAQRESFSQIAQQAGQNFAATTSGLTTAINGLNEVLGTTRDVARLAKEDLESVTGGDSVAYLAPQPPTEDGGVPLAIVNPGRFPLTGVTVVIRDVTTYPFLTFPTVSVGTLASHLVRPLDITLRPALGTNPPGIASFSINIYAQNGTSQELLQFRRGKKMLWDYRASVFRLAPAPHTMISKHSNPTSDIPGFKFTYGWLEDRPTKPQ